MVTKFKADPYTYTMLKLVTMDNTNWYYKGIKVEWSGLEYRE